MAETARLVHEYRPHGPLGHDRGKIPATPHYGSDNALLRCTVRSHISALLYKKPGKADHDKAARPLMLYDVLCAVFDGLACLLGGMRGSVRSGFRSFFGRRSCCLGCFLGS